MLSPWKDAIIVLIIVLLFFGPKRLPALSRSIGESIREFKGGIAQATGSDDKSELPANSGSEAAPTGVTSEEARASEHTNA